MQKYQRATCGWWTASRTPSRGAMGNQMYVATFSTFEEMEQFYADVLAVTDADNDTVQKELSEVLALGEPGRHYGPHQKAEPLPRRQAHHGRDKDHDQSGDQDEQPEKVKNTAPERRTCRFRGLFCVYHSFIFRFRSWFSWSRRP